MVEINKAALSLSSDLKQISYDDVVNIRYHVVGNFCVGFKLLNGQIFNKIARFNFANVNFAHKMYIDDVII